MNSIAQKIGLSVFCSLLWWVAMIGYYLDEGIHMPADAVREERLLAGLGIVTVLGIVTGIACWLPLLLAASACGFVVGSIYTCYILLFE